MQAFFSDLKNTVSDAVGNIYQGGVDLFSTDQNQKAANDVRQAQRLRLQQQQKRLDAIYHQGRAQGFKAQTQNDIIEARAESQLAQYKRKALQQMERQKLQRNIEKRKNDLQWQLQRERQQDNPQFIRGTKLIAKDAGQALWETTKDVADFAGQTIKSGFMGTLDTISGLAKSGSAVNNVGQGTSNILKGNIWSGVKQIGQGAWQGTTGGLQLGGGLLQGAAALVPLAAGAYMLKRGRQSDTYTQYKKHLAQGGKISDFAVRKLQNAGQSMADTATKGLKAAKFGLKHGTNALLNPNKLSVAYSLLKDAKNQLSDKTSQKAKDVKKKLDNNLKGSLKGIRQKITSKVKGGVGKLKQLHNEIVKNKIKIQQLPDQPVQQQIQEQIDPQGEQQQEQIQQMPEQKITVIKTKKIKKGKQPGMLIPVEDATSRVKNLKSIQFKESLNNERMIQQYGKR